MFVSPNHQIRFVLFKTGVYDLHRVEDGIPEHPYKPFKKYYFRSGRIEAYSVRPPLEAGTFVMAPSNIVFEVSPQYLSRPGPNQRRVYRIFLHGSDEYLADERSGWAQKYEKTKDTNAISHALRQEKR